MWEYCRPPDFHLAAEDNLIESKKECVCKKKISQQQAFQRNAKDATEAIIQVMTLCGIPEYKTRGAAFDIVLKSLTFFDEITYRVDRAPRKRICREDLIYRLSCCCRFTRKETQLTYGITRRVFRALYFNTKECGEKIDPNIHTYHSQECAFVHAAKKIAQIFAIFEGMFFKQQIMFENRMMCVFKSLYDKLEERAKGYELKKCECPKCCKQKKQKTENGNKTTNDENVKSSSSSENIPDPKEKFCKNVCEDRRHEWNRKHRICEKDESVAEEIEQIVDHKCNCPKLKCDVSYLSDFRTPSLECSQGPFVVHWLPMANDENICDDICSQPEQHGPCVESVSEHEFVCDEDNICESEGKQEEPFFDDYDEGTVSLTGSQHSCHPFRCPSDVSSLKVSRPCCHVCPSDTVESSIEETLSEGTVEDDEMRKEDKRKRKRRKSHERDTLTGLSDADKKKIGKGLSGKDKTDRVQKDKRGRSPNERDLKDKARRDRDLRTKEQGNKDILDRDDGEKMSDGDTTDVDDEYGNKRRKDKVKIGQAKGDKGGQNADKWDKDKIDLEGDLKQRKGDESGTEKTGDPKGRRGDQIGLEKTGIEKTLDPASRKGDQAGSDKISDAKNRKGDQTGSEKTGDPTGRKGEQEGSEKIGDPKSRKGEQSGGEKTGDPTSRKGDQAGSDKTGGAKDRKEDQTGSEKTGEPKGRKGHQSGMEKTGDPTSRKEAQTGSDKTGGSKDRKEGLTGSEKTVDPTSRKGDQEGLEKTSDPKERKGGQAGSDKTSDPKEKKGVQVGSEKAGDPKGRKGTQPGAENMGEPGSKKDDHTGDPTGLEKTGDPTAVPESKRVGQTGLDKTGGPASRKGDQTDKTGKPISRERGHTEKIGDPSSKDKTRETRESISRQPDKTGKTNDLLKKEKLQKGKRPEKTGLTREHRDSKSLVESPKKRIPDTSKTPKKQKAETGVQRVPKSPFDSIKKLTPKKPVDKIADDDGKTRKGRPSKRGRSPGRAKFPSKEIPPGKSIWPGKGKLPDRNVSPGKGVWPGKGKSPSRGISPGKTLFPRKGRSPFRREHTGKGKRPEKIRSPRKGRSPIKSARTIGRHTLTPAKAKTKTGVKFVKVGDGIVPCCVCPKMTRKPKCVESNEYFPFEDSSLSSQVKITLPKACSKFML